MKEVYIHTLHYHHYGRGNRRSKIMFPISYGPFKDEDSAWEWVRRSGITHGTKLMSAPAKENVEVPYQHLLSMKKDRKFSGSLSAQTQPSVGDSIRDQYRLNVWRFGFLFFQPHNVLVTLLKRYFHDRFG